MKICRNQERKSINKKLVNEVKSYFYEMFIIGRKILFP